MCDSPGMDAEATSLETQLATIERDGYVIVPDALPQQQVAELTRALEPYERDRPMGRNDFEGERSHRVYSLAGKGSAFLELAENPRVVALLDALLLPNYLLSTLQSIRLYPGETPQPWHTDDTFYPAPRPLATRLAVSVIWALEDFKEENGATQLIPGSHLWGTEHPDAHEHTVASAVMKRGSAIVFDGALWHRGGANQSQGTRLCISPQYCQPWLRPQESQLLIAPPETARAASPRMRSMLGYNIHPPFVGQVDGMHPLRLIDPDYRRAKSGAAQIADRVLARPEIAIATRS
jgi:ectoine hydroxylase-related dioxygenase (phytanoyl-CoA dioxygenase family)